MGAESNQTIKNNSSTEIEETTDANDPILKTKSKSLQQKLDKLALLASQNKIHEFVTNFVPLDLTPEETQAFKDDLVTEDQIEEEELSSWDNLKLELQVIASGRGVTKIDEMEDGGNQVVFSFQHPVYSGCDREVVFICNNGEWRAEG